MDKVKYTTEQYEAIDNKLVKALFSFQYNEEPFWTLLGMRMKRVPIDNHGTIDVLVDSRNVVLRYDPEIVDKSELSELRYHFVHECLHLIYRHMFRFAYSKDVIDLASLKKDKPTTSVPVQPIKAADLAADLIANRDAFAMYKDFAKYGVSPSDIPNFAMPNFLNCSSEDVEKYLINTYTQVVQGQGNGQKKEQGQGQGNGQDEQGQGGQGNEQGQGPTSVGGKDVNSHMPGISNQDDDLTKRVKQGFVEQMISKSANQAGDMGKGNIPNSLKEELELIQRPPRKDWKALLAEYVKCSIPKDSIRTWSRINRRHPYLIKGKKPKRVPLIGVAMDTSGSVSDKELQAFLEEINHIRKVHGSDLDIVQCDCVITDVLHVSAKGKMPSMVSGRGGTEYVPALNWFDKAKRKPDVVIFFTDLFVNDNDVPKEPRSYNIIWVGTNTTQVEHFEKLGKYGKFIAMEIETTEQ